MVELLKESSAETVAGKLGAGTSVKRLVALMILPAIGMFGTFQGLQQILIPEQMEALDPVNKVTNLGFLTTITAISAVVALPVGGAVSDKTTGRFGRRTPWLAAMALISGLLMLLMGREASLPIFALTYVGLWFTMNFFQGALTAALPDRVPLENRGMASAMVGLSVPLGIIFGVNIAARAEAATSYAVLATTLIVLTATYLIFAPEGAFYGEKFDEHANKSKGKVISIRSAKVFFSSFLSHDFSLAFLSRAMLFIAYFTVSGYMFYYMKDVIGASNIPSSDVKIGVSQLSTINMVAWIGAIFVAGWMADKFQRHKLIVGASAVGLALSLLVPVVFPSWHGMVAYSVLNGVFFGTYMAVDLALMSFVLPEEGAAGRDMGILAVATAAPQLVSPTLAAWLIVSWGYQSMYLFAAVVALCAGGCTFLIRGVR